MYPHILKYSILGNTAKSITPSMIFPHKIVLQINKLVKTLNQWIGRIDSRYLSVRTWTLLRAR